MNFQKTLIAAALALGAVGAQAATIGLFGFNSNPAIEAFLDGAGHTATDFGGDISAANLAGLDVAILLRADGNAELTAFVNGGGRLITEWSAATYGMGLLGGAASFSGFIASPDTITFTAAGLSVSAGVGASYGDRGRTDFFYDITNLGSATLYAERSSGADAMAYGAVGAGDVFVNAYDWADWAENGDATISLTQNLLLNQIDGGRNGQVPVPGTLALLGIGLVAMGLRRKQA